MGLRLYKSPLRCKQTPSKFLVFIISCPRGFSPVSIGAADPVGELGNYSTSAALKRSNCPAVTPAATTANLVLPYSLFLLFRVSLSLSAFGCPLLFHSPYEPAYLSAHYAIPSVLGSEAAVVQSPLISNIKHSRGICHTILPFFLLAPSHKLLRVLPTVTFSCAP